MSKGKFSIKLKTAAEEIKEILRKHEITGAFGLHDSEGFGEYVVHITAPYSCAYMHEDDTVQFWSKLKEFDGDQEKQQEQQRATANMLNILTQMMGQNFMILEGMSTKFDKLVGAEHTEGEFHHGK